MNNKKLGHCLLKQYEKAQELNLRIAKMNEFDREKFLEVQKHKKAVLKRLCAPRIDHR